MSIIGYKISDLIKIDQDFKNTYPFYFSNSICDKSSMNFKGNDFDNANLGDDSFLEITNKYD